MRKHFKSIRFKPNQFAVIKINAPSPLTKEKVFLAENPGKISLSLKFNFSTLYDQLNMLLPGAGTKIQAIQSQLDNKYGLKLPKVTVFSTKIT